MFEGSFGPKVRKHKSRIRLEPRGGKDGAVLGVHRVIAISLSVLFGNVGDETMTFALWSILLAAILPIVWAGMAKTGASGYENARPRVHMNQLTGWHQRADWAQANSYEAFPPFAAGVIVAHVVGANQLIVDLLAGIFLCARILYGVFYIKDKHMARSFSWLAGSLCTIGFFVAAALAA